MMIHGIQLHMKWTLFIKQTNSTFINTQLVEQKTESRISSQKKIEFLD